MSPLRLVSFLKEHWPPFQFSTHAVFGHHGKLMSSSFLTMRSGRIPNHDLPSRNIGERSWRCALLGGSHRINNGVLYFAGLYLLLNVPSILLTNSPLSSETLWQRHHWSHRRDLDPSLRDTDLSRTCLSLNKTRKRSLEQISLIFLLTESINLSATHRILSILWSIFLWCLLRSDGLEI